jgi:hypothetical protein
MRAMSSRNRRSHGAAHLFRPDLTLIVLWRTIMLDTETPTGRPVRTRPRRSRKAFLVAFTFHLVQHHRARHLQRHPGRHQRLHRLRRRDGLLPQHERAVPGRSFSPGFLKSWSNFSWIGPRLASWGFVVVGINTTRAASG